MQTVVMPDHNRITAIGHNPPKTGPTPQSPVPSATQATKGNVFQLQATLTAREGAETGQHMSVVPCKLLGQMYTDLTETKTAGDASNFCRTISNIPTQRRPEDHTFGPPAPIQGMSLGFSDRPAVIAASPARRFPAILLYYGQALPVLRIHPPFPDVRCARTNTISTPELDASIKSSSRSPHD